MFGVIIPTINRPDRLGRLLDSLSRQTVLPNEVIVVDQSTDSKSIQLTKKGRYSRLNLRIIHDNNITGLAQAKNIGVGAITIKTTYLFFFDDDIELPPTFLEEMISTMNKHKILYGLCATQELPDDKRKSHAYGFMQKMTRKGEFDTDVFETPNELEADGIILRKKISGGITVYRSELFKKFHFDESLIKYSLGEDYDFSYRVSKKYSIGKTSKICAKHYHEKANRFQGKDKVDNKVCFFHYFYKKNIQPKNLKNKTSFVLVMAGIFADAALLSIKNFTFSPIVGFFSGLNRSVHAYKGAKCIKI